MLGEAVMLAACVSVLPDKCFARRVLEVAASPNCSLPPWVNCLKPILERLGGIPSFREWLEQDGNQNVEEIIANRNVRKMTLRR